MTTRSIGFKLMIDWDNDTTYTDESAYLISAQGDSRYVAPASSLMGGSGITAQMTIVLDNSTGRFSPLNTSGALYTHIQSGKAYMRPCYLEVAINNYTINDAPIATYYRIFTGVLKLPGAMAPAWNETSTVTFDVRSRDELMLNRRISTPQADFRALVDTQPTEEDVIAEFGADGGFASGQFTLAPGLFIVPFAWMDDESLLDELWGIAAACGGRFYADHAGQFRYESMETWQIETRSTTSQQTYTPASWQRLEFQYDDTDLYNEVTVEASPRVIGNVDLIWEIESPVTIQPGQTETITASFDTPAYSITGMEYRASSTGGIDVTADITVTPVYYAQRAIIVIENDSTMDAHIYSLRIVGSPIVGGPEQEARRTSVANGANSAYFSGRVDRNRRYSGNPYIQSITQAETLAQRILDLSEYPRLTFNLYGTPGNPDLRLGDRITIDHSSIAGFMSSTTTCYIVGLRWLLDGSGFTQDIEALQTAQVFKFDNDYFRLGTDTITSTRKVFY